MGLGLSRRSLLTGVGSVAAASVAGTLLDATRATDGWSAVPSPTEKTLYDVAAASDATHAAGASGVVIRRGSDGWTVVLADGPSGNSETLEGVDATDDGLRLWIVGASGRLGSYAVTDDTVRDRSAPGGFGGDLHDVAVVGPVGSERVYAAAGSGTLLVGTRATDGTFDWSVVDTDGTNAVTAVDFRTAEADHAVTTGPGVFGTTDGGATWTAVTPADAAGRFFAVTSGSEVLRVGVDDGRIWRRDCECALWTPLRAGSKAVRAVAERDGRLLGAGEGGRVFERRRDGWTAVDTPVGNVLLGALPGSTDVAVGNSGTILER
ncbi:MAG: WD40/YVTN/BNR-like repeat-containing protein [Halolamina sp.]